MKTIVIRITIAFILCTTCFACKKNFPDGDVYQEPTMLKIQGPVTVAANSTQTYYTYYLDNGNYAWTVPVDATITSTPQQGKSGITVKFGTQSGKVTVSAKGMTASIDVTVK